MGWFRWAVSYVTLGLVVASVVLFAVSVQRPSTTKTLQCFIPPGRFVQITDVQKVVHEKEMLVVFRNNERMYLKPAPGTACSLVTHDKTETLDVPKLPAVQEEESI